MSTTTEQQPEHQPFGSIVAEMNDRLHERTQGFMRRAAADRRTIGELVEALAEMVESYEYEDRALLIAQAVLAKHGR